MNPEKKFFVYISYVKTASCIWSSATRATRCGIRRELTYDCVKSYPEHPAPHNLSASQSEAARSESVGPEAALGYNRYASLIQHAQTSPFHFINLMNLMTSASSCFAEIASNHGSSSFITDATGYAVQHLQYLPFGETFVDQTPSNNPYDSRYTFSAKEKPACRNASSGRDDETQYSYFGARYYDSDLSVFLSVDMFAEKYPHLSAYNYCSLNPVNLIDINGDSIVLNGISSGFEGYTEDDRLQSFESYLKDGTGGKVDVSFHSKSPDGAEDVTFDMTLKEGETLTDEEQQFFDYITSINGMEDDFQVGLGDLDFGEMPKGIFYANDYSGSYGKTYDVAFDYRLLNAMPYEKSKFGFGKKEMLMLGLSKGDYQKFNQASGFSVYSVQQGSENKTGAYITKISTESGPIIFKVRHFNYVFGSEGDSFSYQVK